MTGTGLAEKAEAPSGTDHTTGERQRRTVLVTGECVSAFGNSLTSVGFPAIGATLLHLSPAELSLLWAAPWFPWLVAVQLGQLSSRFPARRVLITADLAAAVGLVTLSTAWATGHLSLALMCAVAMVNGVGTVLFKAAFPLLIHLSFRPRSIMPLNSALFAGSAVVQAVAPIVSGVLLSSTSPSLLFALDAATFLVSATVLLRLRSGPAGAATGTAVPRPDPAVARVSGARLIAADVRLRYLLLVSAVSNAGVVGYSSILVVLLVGDSGTSGTWVGVAFAGQAVGSVAGSVLTRRAEAGRLVAGSRRAVRRLAFRLALVCGPLTLLLVLSGPGPALGWAFAGNAAVGTSIALLSIVRSNYLSEHVPAGIITRITSTSQLLTNGATLAGALTAGALTEVLPVRLVVGLFVTLQLLSGVLIVLRFDSAGGPRSPWVRHAERHGPFWRRPADSRG
ncbi:MFS transporter [Streptomyces sp. NPDC054784]